MRMSAMKMVFMYLGLLILAGTSNADQVYIPGVRAQLDF